MLVTTYKIMNTRSGESANIPFLILTLQLSENLFVSLQVAAYPIEAKAMQPDAEDDKEDESDNTPCW